VVVNQAKALSQSMKEIDEDFGDKEMLRKG